MRSQTPRSRPRTNPKIGRHAEIQQTATMWEEAKKRKNPGTRPQKPNIKPKIEENKTGPRKKEYQTKTKVLAKHLKQRINKNKEEVHTQWAITQQKG